MVCLRSPLAPGVRGKTKREARKTCFMAEPDGFVYTYSDTPNYAAPWSDVVRQIKSRVECLVSRQQGKAIKLNAAFLNLYDKSGIR